MTGASDASILVRLRADRRGFFDTVFAGMFGLFLLFVWVLLFISIIYYVQGAVQASLTSQGVAQMVSLLPAPQDVTSAQRTLNDAIGNLTTGTSPSIACSVSRYTFFPADSGQANATVGVATTCTLDTLVFGRQTLTFKQDVAVFYAHVID